MREKKKFAAENCDVLFETEPSFPIDDREVCGCRQKTITAGEVRECEIYPIYGRRASLSRARKERATPEKQKKQNAKNTRKRIVRLLNANFTKEDIWATFTYDNKHLPKDMKRARKNLQNYLRRVAYWMEKKKLGPLKYLYVTEYINNGKEVRIHHHVVMNFPDRDIAERLWNGGGRTQTRRLQPDESGLEGLGRYVSKSRSVKYEKTWAASRNLKEPKITVSDTAISRRRARDFALNYNDAVAYFERQNKGYKVIEFKTYISDIVSGVYIYVKMRRRD